MIQIQHQKFARACNKATQLKPVVLLGAENIVIGSNGAWHVVSLDFRAGSVWAECTCPAGRGDRLRGPLPCYHVAAVMFAFAERALARSAELTTIERNAIYDITGGGEAYGLAIEREERSRGLLPEPHHHACPRCHDLWRCEVPGCAAIDDLVCDGCDTSRDN